MGAINLNMGNKTLSIVFACAIAGVLGAPVTAYADVLPIYDIDSACSGYVIRLETNSAKDEKLPYSREEKIKNCILNERRAYGTLKTEWDALNPMTKTPCLLEAAKYMRNGQYYSALNTCIQGRIQYDMFPDYPQ